MPTPDYLGDALEELQALRGRVRRLEAERAALAPVLLAVQTVIAARAAWRSRGLLAAAVSALEAADILEAAYGTFLAREKYS